MEGILSGRSGFYSYAGARPLSYNTRLVYRHNNETAMYLHVQSRRPNRTLLPTVITLVRGIGFLPANIATKKAVTIGAVIGPVDKRLLRTEILALEKELTVNVWLEKDTSPS